MTPIDTKSVQAPVIPISQEEAPGFVSITPPQDISNSPFAKMFPGGATKEDLQGFIDNCLKMLVTEMKRADERWKKSQKRLRQIMEGKIPDE